MSSVIANHTHFVLSAVVARKAAMALPFSFVGYEVMFHSSLDPTPSPDVQSRA